MHIKTLMIARKNEDIRNKMHGHLCKIIYKTEVVIFVKILNID